MITLESVQLVDEDEEQAAGSSGSNTGNVFLFVLPGVAVWSLFMLGANLAAFTALRTMPLVDVSALIFTSPLIVTALSGPLLGERVGPRRWAAVAVGLAGALLVIRPGPGILQTTASLANGTDFVVWIPLPASVFPDGFPFYGQSYAGVYLSTEGWMAFVDPVSVTTAPDWTNGAISSSSR